MKTRNSSVVAAATVGLAACLSITIQPAQAATVSWGSLGTTGGAADLSPPAAFFPATDASSSFASDSTGSGVSGDGVAFTAGGTSPMADAVMATGVISGGRYPIWQPFDRSEHQGLLGSIGFWQGLTSSVHMTLNGSDLMPLYEHSVQGWGFDPRTGHEWQEVSVGTEASLSLALNPTHRPAGLGR